MGEIVVDSDCRFTLPELAVVVVAVSKAELTSSTVLEASVAVLAFSVAAACFALASAITELASAILSSGFEVVVGDPVVVNVCVSLVVVLLGETFVITPSVLDPGDGEVDAGSASHSSSTVAAPEVTDLKQYSPLSGVPFLKSQCQQ